MGSLWGAVPPAELNVQKCISHFGLLQTSHVAEHIAFLYLWCFNKIILCTQRTEEMPLSLHYQYNHPSWVLATWRATTLPFPVVLMVWAPPAAARVACGWVQANEDPASPSRNDLRPAMLPNEANPRQWLLILRTSVWATLRSCHSPSWGIWYSETSSSTSASAIL